MKTHSMAYARATMISKCPRHPNIRHAKHYVRHHFSFVPEALRIAIQRIQSKHVLKYQDLVKRYKQR